MRARRALIVEARAMFHAVAVCRDDVLAEEAEEDVRDARRLVAEMLDRLAVVAEDLCASVLAPGT